MILTQITIYCIIMMMLKNIFKHFHYKKIFFGRLEFRDGARFGGKENTRFKKHWENTAMPREWMAPIDTEDCCVYIIMLVVTQPPSVKTLDCQKATKGDPVLPPLYPAQVKLFARYAVLQSQYLYLKFH